MADTYWFFHTHIYLPKSKHLLGLVNWNKSRCATDMDPLEQVMHITLLEKYIDIQIQPDLGECHPNNILVRGVSCLMMFHTNNPPFTDLQQFVPSLCKGLTHLKTCWHPVFDSCPGNITDLIDNIIGIYKLVCQISNDDKASKIITLWAGAFRTRSNCQVIIQHFSIYIQIFDLKQSILRFLDIILDTLDCLIGSLDDAVNKVSENENIF